MNSMGGSLNGKPRKQPQTPMKSRSPGELLSVHYSKVRVRNFEGKYLIAVAGGWSFSFDRSRALVFDYLGDETRAQLASITKVRDLPLELVPVEPKDFLERCDCCQQLSPPTDISFDGIRFVCRRCSNWPASLH